MKLTKQALRGVIKEVLREAQGLAGQAGEEATKSKLAMAMKQKMMEFVKDPEVKPMEIQVLTAVINALMETARTGNLASGTAQSVLKMALARLPQAPEEEVGTEIPPTDLPPSV